MNRIRSVPREPANPGEPEPPKGWRLGFAAGAATVLSLLLSVIYFAGFWITTAAGELEAPRVVEPVLRAATAGGDAVFVLTVQQETRIVGGRPSRWYLSRRMETVLHVDLWRSDSRTMKPVWRHRLLTQLDGFDPRT